MGYASDSAYVGDGSSPRVWPLLRYESPTFSIGTDGLRLTLTDRAPVRIKGVMSPRFTGLSDPDAPELAGIDRDITADVGVTLRYSLGTGTALTATVLQEVTGQHDGQEVRLGGQARLGAATLWPAARLRATGKSAANPSAAGWRRCRRDRVAAEMRRNPSPRGPVAAETRRCRIQLGRVGEDSRRYRSPRGPALAERRRCRSRPGPVLAERRRCLSPRDLVAVATRPNQSPLVPAAVGSRRYQSRPAPAAVGSRHCPSPRARAAAATRRCPTRRRRRLRRPPTRRASARPPRA